MACREVVLIGFRVGSVQGAGLVVLLRRGAVLLIAAGLLASTPAYAGLGGTLASVQADSARLGAHAASTSFGGYVRHDMTRQNGGSVREYTNAEGQVFAVTWAGPGRPDLRTLLGPHFSTFQAAHTSPGRMMHALRQPLQASEPDLQIESGGHMGWFRGGVFIPSLAPAGVSLQTLSK
jgi:hypothetical protein